MPVVPPFINTEKITVDVPSLKFTGVELMLVSTVPACCRLRVARDQVRSFARELGDHVLVDERVRRLDHAEADEQQERQNDRELDDALSASRAQPCESPVCWCHHWNNASFFMVDCTRRLTWPPVKNGRIRGVMNCQV